jgi:prevent-host-death family protein
MVQSKSAGAVTVRELARSTSAVIDRVRVKDAPMIITRNGLPVAAIHPLEIDPWKPESKSEQGLGLGEPDIDIEEFELDEDMKLVLSQVKDPFHPHDVSRIIGRRNVYPGSCSQQWPSRARRG